MKKFLLFLFLLCNVGLFAQSKAKTSVKSKTTKTATKPKPKTTTKVAAKKTAASAVSTPIIKEEPSVAYNNEPTQIFNTGIIYHSPYELTDVNLITKEVVTYGKVVQVSAKKTWDNKPMYFINLEKRYPDNLITLMAFKDSYESDYSKIAGLLNKTILVSGKVEVNEKHKQEGVGLKPSITIYSRKQIRIISDF
jgi:hypothetical protein